MDNQVVEMTGKKQHKYLKKKVEFNGSTLVMFSLDGDTWSTRKEELLEIVERHELQKQNFGGQIKGGPQVKTIKPEVKVKPKKLRRFTPMKAREEEVEESVKPESVVKAPVEAKAAKKKAAAKKKTATKEKSESKTKTKVAAKKKTSTKSKAKTKTKSKTKSKAKASKKIATPKSRATASPKKKTSKAKQKKRA